MSEENQGLPREKFEPVAVQPIELRSEEHTSELQSPS